MRKRMLRSFATLLSVIILNLMTISAAAQQGGTTSYVYDNNGRLQAVISPTGETAVYEYDPAGNITAIRRLPVGILAILAFFPHEGLPGDQVTFSGVGFAAGVNAVSFNGVNGRIVSANVSTLVVEVPEGATTGPITITSSSASATTSQPFVLRGVGVRPASSRLLFGESLQFTVRVETTAEDQSVTWSINGSSGDDNVGMISTTGLYTAPNREGTPLVVRATSNADPSLFGEAEVTVRDPNNLQALLSSVSVRYGLGNAETSLAAVSVRYGVGNADTAVASPVSVRYGVGIIESVISRGMSVQYGLIDGQTPRSGAVSATTGPHVTGISPSNLARGTSATITITGANLDAVNSLTFIDINGAVNSGITVSNIVPNADGFSLTATVTVNSNASIGRRVVIAATPNVGSLTTDVGSNTVQIGAP